MTEFQRRLEANIRESLRFAVGEVQDDAVAHMVAGVNAVLNHPSAATLLSSNVPEIDEGRFEEWSLRDFAGQCRMQARDQLDPEFSRFMAALANRLSQLHLAVAAVLESDAEFRSNLPKDWGGDPLSDELDGLRRIFEATPPSPQPTEAL